MAKKSAVNRNNMVKRLVKTYAAKRETLKAIANDESRPLEERFEARLKLAELPRNSSKTRIRNRCDLTGRPRATYRKFKMARNKLRELASRGHARQILAVYLAVSEPDGGARSVDHLHNARAAIVGREFGHVSCGRDTADGTVAGRGVPEVAVGTWSN